MITPNKVVEIRDSALAASTRILACGPASWPISDLYAELAEHFESIDQFLLAIDALYVLNRIDVDMESGVVSYVDVD